MAVVTLALFFVVFWASKTTANPTATYDYVELALNKDPVNPGPCDIQSHGQIKLVKDRVGEDRLIVCAENSNSNSRNWKFLDGRSAVGEYFEPAHDCSDVVDRVPTFKDGLYWIKNEAVDGVVKVWCDVNTDGGGYMLVAKKNDPVTWIVPSTNETVHPQGAPHWSSIFGKMNMSDLRIQFSTTPDFKDTKADWSFRLSNKRPFGELLVRNGGSGCTEHNPGIGDISYVKDLLVGKVVNTHFRCSLFSAHLSDEIGWGMMNKCLQMSCPNGFAIVQVFGKDIQLDDHGSFSYSAYKNATSSGILHSSTSFIGCSNKKCCACYGPRGGTDNYCLKDCTPINGGIVTKKVYTWIWIRSSVPKRVWRKCIEKIKTDSSGKKQKYRINEETGIEEKGSCAYSEEIKKSGPVLVAPNEKIAKKIPSVEGLILYSSNDKKLFIQGEKGWNEIAMEKEIKNEQQIFEQRLEQQSKNTKQELEQIKNEQLVHEQTFEQKLKNTKQDLEKNKKEQLAREKMFKQKLNNTKQKLENQISTLNKKYLHLLYPVVGCRGLKLADSSLSNGVYTIGSSQGYCDMSNGGWTLIAVFSNADSKNWMSNGNLWYDRISSLDHTYHYNDNRDMISEAFWKVKANEFKITRSDDSSHTALLQTTSNCLQGGTFRSKITRYGNFRNGAVWASDQCRGSCRVTYGGQYKTTAGFEMHSCSSGIQSWNYIGFWCDWSQGDGAVMMIGGGGSGCNRADHGIGITEENEAKFGGTDSRYDFGYYVGYTPPSTYSLNLWVR